jgi:hypothetical protein
VTICSTRYDFGHCDVDYVTESDFYSNVTIRLRQVDESDEAQFTLSAVGAAALVARIVGELGADPTPLVSAQLHGQQMTQN